MKKAWLPIDMKFRGFVEAEVLLAAALLSMFVVSITGALYYANQSAVLFGERTQAVLLLDENLEAVRNIRDGGWNELVYDQSAVEVSAGQWIFSGEGTDETLGDYTRTITFAEVCRDASEVIAACPGDHTDLETQLATFEIAYTTFLGVPQTLTREIYLTNWEGIDWTQTDWSGGSGQTVWSDETRYESDNGSAEIGTSGQITLVQAGSGACTGKTWEFNTPSNYTYDSADIEVTGGLAQLKDQSGGGGGYSSITEIDNYEYETSNGEQPSIVNIAGNIYAIAYQGPGSDGFVSTIEISATGIITGSTIDSLEFDTSSAVLPEIIHVSGDIYAIAYQGPRSDGWLATVEIDSAGNITNTLVDSFEFDNSNGQEVDIEHVSGDIYLLAYQGGGSDGFVETIEISTAGIIAGTIDTYEYDTSFGGYPDILPIAGDIYAVTYQGPGSDGWLVTLNVSTAGAITASPVDSLEFDTATGNTPRIIQVSGNYYVIAYEGASTAGTLITVDITAAGAIGAVVDTLVFDAVQGQQVDIIALGSDSFAIVYEGSGNDGYIELVDIDSVGQIAASVTTVYEFDTTEATWPRIIQLDGDYYAVVYGGPGSDGWIRTFEMGTGGGFTGPAGVPDVYPTATYSPSSFEQWNAFAEVATKNGGEIYYQLSDDGINWYYWNGTAWAAAGASNYNTAVEVDANIVDFTTTSGQIAFKAFLEGDGTQQVQLDSVTIGCGNLQMEVGSLSVADTWTTVNTQNAYSSPVVVASYYENANTLPASVRVRNVTSNSFDIRLEHPGGSALSADSVTYWIVEQGKWTLDGVLFEAHAQEVSTVAYDGSYSGEQVNLKNGYSTGPNVFHQVVTTNDTDWITSFVSQIGSRMNPPSATGFDIALNAAEVVASQSHGAETIAWIAVDQIAAGTWNGTDMETFQTPDSVTGHDDACYTYPYGGTYTSAPLTLVAQLQMDVAQGGWGVMCSNSTTQAGMHVEEDQESDTERSHGTEVFGVVAFESSFYYGAGEGAGGGGGYSTEAILTSSAFDISQIGAIQIIEWDEDVSSCDPDCDIIFEVRSAPDSAGSPGTWTDWYGAAGSGATFIEPNGTIISTDLNGNQWIQYRVTLTGDGTETPILQEVRINYR